MRKTYEVIMVIAAAGLAAAVALIDIPTHSGASGPVVAGDDLLAPPPPTSAPALPQFPPLLFPPGSAPPIPSEPPATPAPPLLGVPPPQRGIEASLTPLGLRG